MRNVSWSHGDVTVLIADQSMGLVKQWIDGWHPANDSEVCLVLEDDMQVAPNFYSWLKPRLQRQVLGNFVAPSHQSVTFIGNSNNVHVACREASKKIA